jgi:hypothetical protein
LNGKVASTLIGKVVGKREGSILMDLTIRKEKEMVGYLLFASLPRPVIARIG